jgi:hypothetical protein
VAAETRAYLEAMQDTLIRRMEQLNGETRRDLSEQMVRLNAEAPAHAEELNAQRRREFGTMIEAVDDEVRLVAEGVIGLTENFSRLVESTERRLERLEDQVP